MSNKINAQQIYDELIKLRKEVEGLKSKINTRLDEHEKHIIAINKYIDVIEDAFKKVADTIKTLVNIFGE